MWNEIKRSLWTIKCQCWGRRIQGWFRGITFGSCFSIAYSCLLVATSLLRFLKRQVQFSSMAQSYPTFCDPMNGSTPGLPVHPQLLEFTQTHVHRVSDAIQPSHPLSSPSPPAPNLSQHQSLFQWVNTSHEVAKVLEFLWRLASNWSWKGKKDFCTWRRGKIFST